ncbi:helix-turn-helix transcriptional regulator [Dactylosporangium sp. NPDC005572]|uniref:helix-turn-helix domain-containing protein n=1 Tax=Dactylosporangium sp. NPDC005572 TaxID=3156889 RepID=UPI0033A8BA76
MAEALAGRHMGRVVRAYRCHPWHGRSPLPQELVGGWLHLAQAQMSRLENGRPRKHLDWLTFVARTLRIPADRLWFQLDGDQDGDRDGDRDGAGGRAAAVRTLPPRVSNELLRRARLARVSPSGSGRVLSREELAEAVNAWVFTTCGRRICLTDRSIGKLERGDTRWPAEWVRAGLCAVLDVDADADIGLFKVKNFARPADVADKPAPDNVSHPLNAAAAATSPEGWADVAEARRELGRLLAGWRQRAGLTQQALADRVPWASGTVADVERGQEVRRAFWERCDAVTGANGALLAAADHVGGLADRCRAQDADQDVRQRSAAWAARTGEPGGVGAVPAGSAVADAVDPVDAGPAVHITVSAGASVILTLGDGATAAGQPVRVMVTTADEQPRHTDRPTADGARVYSMAAWRGRR